MSYIAKTIIFGSLTAFAVETSVLAHNGKIGHGLPSAVQIAPTLASSGAASMLVVSGALHHFPSAITEAVYPGVADLPGVVSEFLKKGAGLEIGVE